MKPIVDHVRISSKSKEILIRIKRRTGIEHWNEICRIAYCRSLAMPTPTKMNNSFGNTAIDMDWKTFCGQLEQELIAITFVRAQKDRIDPSNRESLAEYFRSHLERGIANLQNIKNLDELLLLRI